MSLSLPDVKFDNTLGAMLVGGLTATALYGVTCMQMYVYFMQGFKDNVWFKSTITFLWVLDTFDAMLNGHFLYFYLVTNFLNPTALLRLVWSVITHVAATAISNYLVRGLFVHRVWLLSNKNIWLVLAIIAASTMDLVTSLVITVKAATHDSFLNSVTDLDFLTNVFYINFAVSTGADLLIALSLCFYLRRSRTGFERTDSLVRSLMTYTVNTGLLVAIDATAGMITYISMPRNFIFLAFYLQLSKLYLNSYLATLNARENLRKTMQDSVNIHLSALSNPGNTRRQQETEFPREVIRSAEKTRPETMGISVSTLVDRKVDGISSYRSPVMR